MDFKTALIDVDMPGIFGAGGRSGSLGKGKGGKSRNSGSFGGRGIRGKGFNLTITSGRVGNSILGNRGIINFSGTKTKSGHIIFIPA